MVGSCSEMGRDSTRMDSCTCCRSLVPVRLAITRGFSRTCGDSTKWHEANTRKSYELLKPQHATFASKSSSIGDQPVNRRVLRPMGR